MHDPRDMTKHQWDLLWCAGQGKKHQDELGDYSQSDPVENAKAARDLLTAYGATECDDPVDAVLNYIVLVRAALVGDVQEHERHAIDWLLSDAEAMLRTHAKNITEAKKRLFVIGQK